ncbi:MAG: Type 1 glutamine amidotransferase-like domain-containing protein [Christensenellaceae bacterium]|nr:Type 1 glutamine amidotransferase-like domain-containing protein [Christensenellaceae bacterium]
MKAKLLGLFSGFPNRSFPEEIAKRLRKVLDKRKKLVFISAWPMDFEQNDRDSFGMHGMFAACGLAFSSFCVIDERTEKAEARELIREASCIFLMGGNATQQFALIRKKELAEDIRESSAVILGVSAGSANMANRALDIWESHEPYDGLGLADITIKAHVSLESSELIETLLAISHKLPVCAMEDDSAIFVENGEVSFVGNIRYMRDGKSYPFTPSWLKN